MEETNSYSETKMKTEKIKADLHTHTTASDGDLTLREIIDKAKNNEIRALAITDHDTVEAVEEAEKYAKEKDIKFVRGVELSTRAVRSVHLLGYGLNIKNKEFLKKLDELKQQRIERNLEIIERLKKFGINLNFSNNITGTTGRLHIAKKMVEQNFVTSINEAFFLYLNENTGKAFIPGEKLTPFTGAQLIKEAGGYVVIAHPLKLYREDKLPDLICGLKNRELLDGLEVYYPKFTNNDIRQLKKIATDNNLFVTGGSDFHNEKHGLMSDVNFEIDETLLTKLMRGRS